MKKNCAIFTVLVILISSSLFGQVKKNINYCELTFQQNHLFDKKSTIKISFGKEIKKTINQNQIDEINKQLEGVSTKVDALDLMEKFGWTLVCSSISNNTATTIYYFKKEFDNSNFNASN